MKSLFLKRLLFTLISLGFLYFFVDFDLLISKFQENEIKNTVTIKYFEKTHSDLSSISNTNQKLSTTILKTTSTPVRIRNTKNSILKKTSSSSFIQKHSTLIHKQLKTSKPIETSLVSTKKEEKNDDITAPAANNNSTLFGERQFTLTKRSLIQNLTKSEQRLVNSYLHPRDCSVYGTDAKFLHYHKSDRNCPGEGHQLFEFGCALGEAHYLNRTLVIPDTFCIGRSHLNDQQEDDHSTTFEDYFDFFDLLQRGVTLITTSGLQTLYEKECMHWFTPKKHKKVYF